jgi:hypothetical protein
MSDIADLKACNDCDEPFTSGDRVVRLMESDAKHGYVYVCEKCVRAQSGTFGENPYFEKIP